MGRLREDWRFEMEALDSGLDDIQRRTLAAVISGARREERAGCRAAILQATEPGEMAPASYFAGIIDRLGAT